MTRPEGTTTLTVTWGSMPDERPDDDILEERDIEHGKAKKALTDDAPPAESALPAADANAQVRPKQLN